MDESNSKSIYSRILRPLLFRLDAEQAHHSTVEMCRWLGAVPGIPAIARALLDTHHKTLPTEVAGLRFDNPIGLAAGWDKSGRALRAIDALGFGHAEIGSVSARPSKGNPRPRLFRLPADRAIIVNYGLPNDGAEKVAKRLTFHRPYHPLGVNIVKTNDGPDAQACGPDDIFADYEQSAALLHRHASYISLNLSCPNAPNGLDFFAQKGNISRLLHRLDRLDITCPVFLKIAPREDPVEQDSVLMQCEAFPWVRGFCFNLPPGKPETLELTTSRALLTSRPGAIAGKPVASLIDRCIASMYNRMDRSRYSIIGAGGVFCAEDAYRKIRLGSSLVQIYTAFVYEGPTVVPRICHGLAQLLERDGFPSVAAAVGTISES